jgi:RHS repeat-associated protein
MIKYYLIILFGLFQPLLAETVTLTGTAGNEHATATVNVIIDTDRDGLLDIQEDVNSNRIVDAGETDSKKADTDGDGLGDMQDTTPLVNQFLAAWNADEANPAGMTLYAAYNFSPVMVNGQPDYINIQDVSGNGRKGKSWIWNANQAIPTPVPQSNMLGMSGGGFVCEEQYFFTFPKPNINGSPAINYALIKNMSFWVKLDAGSLASAQPIFAYAPNGAAYTKAGNSLNPYVMRAMIRPKAGGGLECVFLDWETTTSLHTAWSLGNTTPAQLENRWFNLVFTFKLGEYWEMHLDGVKQTRTHQTPNGSFLQAPGAAPLLEEFFVGADVLSNNLGTNRIINKMLAGKLDRIQFFTGNNRLSQTQINAIVNQDTDGDGMTDVLEIESGSDPAHYETENERDSDRDGLTNSEEAAGQASFNGLTKIFGVTQKDNFDSDGDLFDDYWEAKYFFTPAGSSTANVNPKSVSWPIKDDPLTTTVIEGDYDSDGLSNFHEMLNGTDPNDADTDNDGINDKDEVDYGSQPTDGDSVPLKPANFYGDENLGSFAPVGNLGTVLTAGGDPSPLVTVRVGDPSSSHSERWRMLIGSKRIVAPDFGVVSDPLELALDLTDFHEIKVEHFATDPAWLEGEGNGQPDYDYWAAVQPDKNSPFILCDLEGLLQDPLGIPEISFLDDVDPSEVREKTAYLVPLDNFSWSTSYSGGDAVGPKHRKIALNGRPMPDEKPQQEEESDLPAEETYIDAFNLGLHHDTTFAYTPLGASDLVLQASASTEETGFSDRSGLRPHERFDLPFGIGWTSSLCSYVEVIETIGGEATDPVTVNVVDEAGRPQRFGTVDFHNFFPWPSTRVDKKSYLNTLSRNGLNFTLQKKFGNTLTYAKAKTWFMYSTDRLEGSTQVKRHTYWRLTEARDRYGVRLHYKYDEPGVPNEVSLIPHEISSPDRPNQFLVINRSPDYRRVDSITDSRGNVTTFNYGDTTSFDQGTGASLAPLSFTGPAFTTDEAGQVVQTGTVTAPVAAPRLLSITYADQTSTSYNYHGGIVQDTDASNPDHRITTRHYHANVDTITDKRGNTHQFAYAFDQTKQYWDSSVNGTRAAIDLDRLPTDVKAYIVQQLADMNNEANGLWKTMYGMPRRVSQVILPGTLGSASFSPQGEMRFGKTVSFTTLPSTTVTDAAGNATVYEFKDMDAEIVDVDTTSKSVSAEWMVYYLTSEIHHYQGMPGTGTLLGSEKYEFNKASGLSLWRATDLSGNVTRWEFGNDLVARPPGLGKVLPSSTMTKWADPTAKIDALNRREEYTYGSYRVMSQIDDPYATVTDFTVDALGRRKLKNVQQGGAALLSQERYDYNNQRFKAFQTGTTKLAFASVSGQAWETDLATSYLPDDRGRLWREVIDPQGLKLTTEHTYDFNNNKTSTLDPRGNRTRFAYDKLNRLIEVTYPSAGTRNGEAITTKQIWYDLNGNKAAEIDEEGHYTIFHYDELNRRIKTIRDMDGQGLPSRNAGLVEEANKGTATGNDLVTEVRYDSVNNVTHTIDPNGNVIFTVHDAIRRPVHVFTGLTLAEAANLGTATNAAAASTEKTHTEFLYTDSGLNLPVGGTVKANPGGSAFDSSGFKPTEMIRHDAVLTAAGTASLHTYAAYDALYRPLCTETEYEANTYAVSTTAYGTIAAGKEALQTTSTDDREKVTVTLMDGLLRATSVTDAHGTTLAAISQTVYSSTGLVWKTIDPLSRETETEYDAAGRPSTVWQPDPVSGLVNRSTPNHPLTGSPRTQTLYDKNGNTTASINPLGHRWDYGYDARNRKTFERQPAVTNTEIVNGQPVETPLRNPITLTAYDGVGNVISTTDARDHITRSFHDFAYRVTDVLSNPVSGNPSPNPQAPGANDILTHTIFDPSGNPLEITDGNGNATRNTYDTLNRLLTTATNPVTGQPSVNPASPAPGDITVTNDYDDSNNLVKVTDGEGHITGFRWDGLSRKTRTLWDEGSTVERTEQASYDGLVQLTRIDPKNQLTTYQYDALNRLENILYTGAATDNRHNEYDLVGNLRAVTYPNESEARQTLRGAGQVFDNLNRLREETSAGATHVHTYDKAGNRITTTYAATGRTLTSAYDKLNRLITLTESGAGVPPGSITTYGYDLSGNTTRKTLPNGTATQSTFDALNRRLKETTRTTAGGLVSSFDYSTPSAGYPSGYDNVGNLLHIAESYGRSDVKARNVTNNHDRAYRLKMEIASETGGTTVTTTYDYDKANNRTSKIITGGTSPGTEISAYGQLTDGYNSNQLKSVTKGATITTFQYDSNGNRSIKQVGGITSQTYGYDFDNRLTGLTDTTKGTFAYTYDHRTRRVGRNEQGGAGVPPAASEISFSGGLSVQEYATGGTTPNVELIRGSDYGGGIGGVLYTIRGSARSYNAYNSRGDVVSQTSAAAVITWQSSYEAFGTRTQEKGATSDRQKANTKDEDPTGLLNEGMRYRDLEFGIFLTRDPAGFVDGPNIYTYVRQNPWSAFDPLGLATTFQDEDTHSSSTEIPEPEYQPAPENTATVDVGGSSARDLNELAAASAAAEANPVQIQTDWSGDHSAELWAATASPAELDGEADSGRHGDKLTKLFRRSSQAKSNAAHDWLIIAGMAEAAGWGLSFLEPTPFGESAMAGRTLAKAAKATAVADGSIYSTAFQTTLKSTSYPGASRAAHFQEANGALLQAMEGSTEVAARMQGLGINVQRTATGLAPRQSPAGWTWHHAPEPGVMQLVPRTQHAPGSIFQQTLHPGGQGGMATWGR